MTFTGLFTTKNSRRFCFIFLLVATFSIPSWSQTREAKAIEPPENPRPQNGGEKEEETPAARSGRLARLLEWEKSWLIGDSVLKGEKLAPLSGEERMNLYLKQTLTTPGAYLKRAFAAGIDQARGEPTQWDGGFKGYGERFASREGQFISANTIAAISNAALHYEPRYEQCQCSGFWPRTRHAIVRNFITYDDTETQKRLQLGLYFGAFGGGAIASTWLPTGNTMSNAGWAVLGQAGYGSLLNFFTEFAVDINRKLGAKK
ncbi:MAG TPA: hypothetical protein VI386_38195 [Candidatus Sulfotelmatobacter sp.]